MVPKTIGAGRMVALPSEFLAAARIGEGDVVGFEVTGPTTLAITILPRAVPDASEAETAVGRSRIGTESDDVDPTAPVDYDALPRLTLAELLERYPIEEPIDFEADRESIRDEMAKDVFGERFDRFAP